MQQSEELESQMSEDEEWWGRTRWEGRGSRTVANGVWVAGPALTTPLSPMKDGFIHRILDS